MENIWTNDEECGKNNEKKRSYELKEKIDMRRLEEKIIEVIKNSVIFDKINVVSLFGSYAKNKQTRKSDIDILIGLSGPVGFEFFRLENKLVNVLKRKVDLLTESAISPYLTEEIYSTRKVIYER